VFLKSTASPVACHVRQRGVSLVEVLVASVVLSIGLLGLAGLQAGGLKVGQSSIYRSQAAQLAYDLIERMRVNAGHAADYALALDDAPPEGMSVAARDLQDWRMRLRALPAGTGAVEVNGREIRVVVQWDDARGAGVLRGNSSDEAAREALRTAQFQLSALLGN
jgi:type IV pilus assembly protein PilV